MSAKIKINGTVIDLDHTDSVHISASCDPMASSLEIDTCEAVVTMPTEMASWFSYNIPFYVVDAVATNTIRGYFLTQDCQRINTGKYKISGVSLLDSLARSPYAGNIWTTATALSTVVDDVIGGVVPYTIKATLSAVTVKGYLPPSDRRAALQQVLFAINAIVVTDGRDDVYITTAPTALSMLSPNDIHQYPSISKKRLVTKITITAHEYTAGTPSTTDEYVTVGGVNYIHTTSTSSVTNPDADENDLDNEILVEDMTLINSTNVAAVLANVAARQYPQVMWSGNVYLPEGIGVSSHVAAAAYNGEMVRGFISACDTNFGALNLSSISFTSAKFVAAFTLLILYMYNETQIGSASYLIADEAEYSIENPVIVLRESGVTVYCPQNDYCTGTMGEEIEVEEPYDIALQQIRHALGIFSVLSAEQDGVTLEIGG